MGPSPYSLTVNKATGGSVTSADGNISCGGTCIHSYNSGDTVVLTATPNSSYWQFVSWSGDCSGTNPSCTVLMNST
ncbi:InlB B-repeat-containing protein [Salmonella enterica]|uniref:InlB B-repeat-containing protein n=1 Tax=Salmonella enterica TaxID=28901 RepID=UPI003EDC8F02